MKLLKINIFSKIVFPEILRKRIIQQIKDRRSFNDN